MKTKISNIIDNQTKELLCELLNDFQIDFEIINIDYCEVFQNNNKAIIYYNPRIIDTESIAHELLHIWLKRFNYSIGNHIFLICKDHKILSKIFSKHLCDFIENFFAHFKMYPKFLEMGYTSEKFINDGITEKCSLKDIKKINLKFLGIYKSQSINLYIGKLLSIYADHLKNDYTIHLKLFKQKDLELFNIITNFWNSWVIFDIENIDPVFNSDIELTDKFISDMKIWIKPKKII